MGSSVTSLFTLLVLMVSLTVPSETRELDLGLYNSVKQNLPDVSSVKNIYDTLQEKTPDLSSIQDVYQSSYSYGRDTVNYYLQDEQARSDLTHLAETLVLAVILELAKSVPGGVPAYNIVSKSLQSDKNSQENQVQSDQLAMLVAEFAKNAGSYAIGKGAKGIPGGEPTYKILSNSLRAFHDDNEFADHSREIKEMRARINQLEKEGCGCTTNSKKLHDQIETPKLDLGWNTENTPNQD